MQQALSALLKISNHDHKQFCSQKMKYTWIYNDYIEVALKFYFLGSM